jgi:putative phosphoesterase
MKLAIISDTHGNLANIETALKKIGEEKIATIIHCGDIGGPETLEVFEKFDGEIFAVLGNMDKGYFHKEDFASGRFFNTKLFGSENSVGADFGETEIDGKEIAIAHFPEVAKDLAESQKYDLVFYGHTHCPHQEKIGKTELINPGNLSGLLYRPSFAVYDTETNKLELKVL